MLEDLFIGSWLDTLGTNSEQSTLLPLLFIIFILVILVGKSRSKIYKELEIAEKILDMKKRHGPEMTGLRLNPEVPLASAQLTFILSYGWFAGINIIQGALGLILMLSGAYLMLLTISLYDIFGIIFTLIVLIFISISLFSGFVFLKTSLNSKSNELTKDWVEKLTRRIGDDDEADSESTAPSE